MSEEISRAIAVRQDLFRLKEMGWPDGFKEVYIKTEHAPDLRIMHLSMFADEYIAELEKKKRVVVNAKENSRT